MANNPTGTSANRKKKANPLRAGQNIDYKDIATLRKFISERGKIRARRVTGLSVQEQRGSPSPSRTLARWRCCRTPRRPAKCCECRKIARRRSEQSNDARAAHNEKGAGMKLILTAAVDNLGLAGDVVEVKDGYGRNYLVPRGFAIRGHAVPRSRSTASSAAVTRARSEVSTTLRRCAASSRT